MKSWKEYPKGNPDIDLALLQNWIEDEAMMAGLSDCPRLEYAPSEKARETWGRAKGVLMGALGTSQALGTHSYRAEIPGLRWPLEITIETTVEGHISSILYYAQLERVFAEEVRFEKERYAMSGDFKGTNAKKLKGNKELLKQMKADLSAAHYLPKRSWFVLTRSGNTQISLDPSFYHVIPHDDGSDVIVLTSVFPPRDLSVLTLNYIPILIGGWSLGLPHIIRGIETLEMLP